MNKCENCGGYARVKYCSVSCQNKHQNSNKANIKYGVLTMFDVVCKKCGIIHQVQEREKIFPSKESYFCSRSCANSRVHSDETKKKLKAVLDQVRIKGVNLVEKVCDNCMCKFKTKPSKVGRFCSRRCVITWNNLNLGINKIGGLNSVQAQGKIKRSKNETYFADLCQQKFKSVKFNEPIFNGWDADIIIDDLKLAISWNGKWHYEKITKKHSVEQVQNRDKIKEKEIVKLGYQHYVIKDMGKWNKMFVENKFQEMLVFLKLIS